LHQITKQPQGDDALVSHVDNLGQPELLPKGDLGAAIIEPSGKSSKLTKPTDKHKKKKHEKTPDAQRIQEPEGVVVEQPTVVKRPTTGDAPQVCIFSVIFLICILPVSN